MIHLAWLLALASNSTLASAQVVQAGAARPWEPCRFAWVVPTSVWVTQAGEKRGHAATMRYLLTLSAGAVDGELQARLTDFEFLEVDGKDVTTPEMRQALASTRALTQAVPDMIVDSTGNFLRAGGVEELVERVIAHEATQSGRDAGQLKRELEFMKSPTVLATLEQACGDYWNTWVGAWVGFELEPGSESTEDQDIPFMGVALPAKVTRRNAGPSAEHPGHVELSQTTVIEGPAAASALAETMATMAQQGGGRPFPKDELFDIRSVSVVTVVIDGTTLKPLRATRSKSMRLAVKGEEPKEQVEHLEYTFDWSTQVSTGAK